MGTIFDEYLKARTVAEGSNARTINNGLGVLQMQQMLGQQQHDAAMRPLQMQMFQHQLHAAQNPAPIKIDVGGAFELRDPRTYALLGSIPKTATPDAALKEQGSMLRHQQPSGGAILQDQTQRFMHGTPSAAALLTDERTRSEGAANRGVTMRGQNMTDARARDANSIASDNRLETAVTNLRKEFNDVPEVKKFRTVQPILQSAYGAPNTAAGDLDLIYAVGKILDPESVVREGELALTIKAGSPMERFKGQVQFITQGKGRLTEQTRSELTNMLEGRVASLRAGYDSAKALYARDAQSKGLPADRIFMDDTFGRRSSDKTPQRGDIVDGHRFKGGDPSRRSNWEKV